MAVSQKRKQWWGKVVAAVEDGYSLADAAAQVKRQPGTIYNEYSYVPEFRREVDAARIRYHTRISDTIERMATLELEHIAKDLEDLRELDIEKRPLQRGRIMRTLLGEMLPHHLKRAERLRDEVPSADPWRGAGLSGATSWGDFAGDGQPEGDEPKPPS